MAATVILLKIINIGINYIQSSHHTVVQYLSDQNTFGPFPAVSKKSLLYREKHELW